MKLDKWQSGNWLSVIVVVDVRYMFVPLKSLNLSQTSLLNKYIGIPKILTFIIYLGTMSSSILGYPGVIPLAASTPGTISWINLRYLAQRILSFHWSHHLCQMRKMTNENDPYKSLRLNCQDGGLLPFSMWKIWCFEFKGFSTKMCGAINA